AAVVGGHRGEAHQPGLDGVTGEVIVLLGFTAFPGRGKANGGECRDKAQEAGNHRSAPLPPLITRRRSPCRDRALRSAPGGAPGRRSRSPPRRARTAYPPGAGTGAPPAPRYCPPPVPTPPGRECRAPSCR